MCTVTVNGAGAGGPAGTGKLPVIVVPSAEATALMGGRPWNSTVTSVVPGGPKPLPMIVNGSLPVAVGGPPMSACGMGASL